MPPLLRGILRYVIAVDEGEKDELRDTIRSVSHRGGRPEDETFSRSMRSSMRSSLGVLTFLADTDLS